MFDTARVRWVSPTTTTRPCKEGGVYNVGFAVHDDNITTRDPMALPLRLPQAETPSCQRKLASRIGLSADVFSNPGFRLSPE